MRIPGADHAIDNLVKWSMNPEWTPLRQQVWAEHFDQICDRVDLTEDEIAELLGEPFGMLFGCVLEDFFTARFGDNGEKNVIDDYLKRRGWREKVPAKRYLEALRDSVLSLYEVVGLDPGRRMTVRDMVRGGDPVTVEEKLGSASAALWDRVAGRIVTVNGKTYFSGSLLLFPHDVAEDLLSAIAESVTAVRKAPRRDAKKQGEEVDLTDSDLRELALLSGGGVLFTQLWLGDALRRALAPPPELRNTDGDEILFSEARFPVTGDIATVTTRIDEMEAFDRDEPDEWRWTWFAGEASPSLICLPAKTALPGKRMMGWDTPYWVSSRSRTARSC